MSSKSKTTATKEEAKPALVPKLRFPEFRGKKGWENKLVGPYLEDCSGRVPPDTELPVYSSTRDGLKRQDAYFDGQVLQNKNEYGVVPPGCFVYRHMSDDGLFKFNINETGGDIAVSKEYPVFTTKGLNSAFLLAKLNDGLEFKHFALSQKAGGTRTRLYFSRLCEWRTLLPTPAEQQKIAECLSSVDELMAAQARKVDALKTHKKGLMQQLFPREGETQPRLRFPEFQNAGEWEIGELGSLSDVRDGTHDSPSFYTTGRPLVTSKNLRPDGTLDLENVSLISEEDYQQINKRSKVSVGDILFGMIGTIGNPVMIQSEGFAIKNVALIKEVGPLLNAFVVQLLQSEYVAAIFAVLNTGNSQKFIALGKIRGLPVPVPSLPEQQRIATCLSSLDALITAETQKHEALKTHKKGLMQQLLPSENFSPDSN